MRSMDENVQPVLILKSDNPSAFNEIEGFLEKEDVRGNILFIDDDIRALKGKELAKYQAEITHLIINL